MTEPKRGDVTLANTKLLSEYAIIAKPQILRTTDLPACCNTRFTLICGKLLVHPQKLSIVQIGISSSFTNVIGCIKLKVKVAKMSSVKVKCKYTKLKYGIAMLCAPMAFKLSSRSCLTLSR